MTNDTILNKHIEELKITLGLTLADLYWLYGNTHVLNRIKSNEVRSKSIDDPTVAILTRFLLKHPEDNILPQMVDMNALNDTLSGLMKKKSARAYMGPLLGCTSQGGYVWTSGTSPSEIVKRLATTLSHVIEKDGEAGLERFLEVVEKEAASRGIDSLDDLFKDGWRSRSLRAAA